MKPFSASRVVVIDDKIDEALPVIRALSKAGVSHVYFSGNRESDLPKKPLRGVAVVVLDMRLGVTGTSKQVANNTAKVFGTVIAEDNGPLIVFLWTRHTDDVEAFKEALFAVHSKFKGSLLISDLSKPAPIKASTANEVAKSIGALVKQWAPMDFLWAWQQMVQDAATETTAVISTQVATKAGILDTDSDEQRRTKWLLALKALLRTLALAAGGKGAPLSSVDSDLLETLAGLHNDRLEQLASERTSKYLIAHLNVAPLDLKSADRAALNSQLLVGQALAKRDELRPGNIYFGKNADQPLFRRLKISWPAIGYEILGNFSADKAAAPLLEDLKNASNDTARAAADKKLNEFRVSLSAKCHHLLIELTPSCDFAQRAHRDRHVAKLATGLLIPESMEKLINKKSESLKLLEAIKIPGLDGIWIPVLFGRAQFAVTTHPKNPRATVNFRLRNSVVTDLRNWYSARFSRSGYLSL